MVTRRLLVRIVEEIRRVFGERGISSRELSELCGKHGYDKITRSKILRAFYVEEGRQFFLNNTDDTIEGVLDVLGVTGDDILERILKEDNDPTKEIPGTNLPQEVIEFIKTKEAEPYLKLAYAQYKTQQNKKELERLQQEIISAENK